MNECLTTPQNNIFTHTHIYIQTHTHMHTHTHTVLDRQPSC